MTAQAPNGGPERGYAPTGTGIAPKRSRLWGGSLGWARTMRGGGWGPRSGAIVAVLAAVLASSILPVDPGALGPPSPAGHLGVAMLPAGDPAWDNGVARLAFSTPVPSFTLTSDADGRVSSSHTLSAIAEVGPGGHLVTLARFQGVNITWRFASVAGASDTVIWANASLPVLGANGEWESEGGFNQTEDGYGTAHVSIIFFLNASGAPDANAVRFTVNVSKWPWANVSDTLGLEMTTFAVGATSLAAAGSPNQVIEVRNDTSTTVATLSWDPEALVRYTGGAGNTSTVQSYRVVGPLGLNSTVRLEFGSVTGGYQELSYDPTVLLNLVAFRSVLPLPAWQWNAESILVLGAMGSVVGILALVAWRNRSEPTSPP